MVSAFLRDPTHGVAAALAALPIDPDITRVTTLPVLDETVEAEATRLQAPDALPALVVNSAGALSQGVVAIQPFPGDVELDLVLRHLVRDSDTEDGLAALQQGQRAIRRTMARFFVVDGRDTRTIRNGIQIYGMRQYRAELYRGNEDSILTMAHTYTLSVRDTWAMTT